MARRLLERSFKVVGIAKRIALGCYVAPTWPADRENARAEAGVAFPVRP